MRMITITKNTACDDRSVYAYFAAITNEDGTTATVEARVFEDEVYTEGLDADVLAAVEAHHAKIAAERVLAYAAGEAKQRADMLNAQRRKAKRLGVSMDTLMIVDALSALMYHVKYLANLMDNAR
jgi:hypothetical protein